MAMTSINPGSNRPRRDAIHRRRVVHSERARGACRDLAIPHARPTTIARSQSRRSRNERLSRFVRASFHEDDPMIVIKVAKSASAKAHAAPAARPNANSDAGDDSRAVARRRNQAQQSRRARGN